MVKYSMSAVPSNRLNQVSTRVYPLSGAMVSDSKLLLNTGMSMANFDFKAKGDIADVEVNLLLGGYKVEKVQYSVDMILTSGGDSTKYHLFYANPISVSYSDTILRKLLLPVKKGEDYNLRIVATVKNTIGFEHPRSSVDFYAQNMSKVTLTEFLAE